MGTATLGLMVTVATIRESPYSGAILPSALMNQPWAKYSGTITSANCSGESMNGYGLVAHIQQQATLWESAYEPLRRLGSANFYIFNSEDGIYMCEDDPATATEGTLVDGIQEIYHRCNTGTTYSPTNHAPTTAPTSNTDSPTAPPITDALFEQLYGPRDPGSECWSDNGHNGQELYYEDNTTTSVRYCCGPSVCNGIYWDTDIKGHQYTCACNPAPGEILVRNNGGQCHSCKRGDGNGPYPDMVYCEDTPLCDRTFVGYDYGCDFGIQTNGCPQYASDYNAPPTHPPTARLEAPPCWQYDDAGTCTSDGTWCSAVQWDLDYIIHPRTSMLEQRASTVDDFFELTPDGQDSLQNTVQNIIDERSGPADSTCWCAERTLDWLPFGMIQYVELEVADKTLSYLGPTVPLRRDFLRGTQYVHQLGAPLYIKTFPFKITTTGYITNVSGTYDTVFPTLPNTYNGLLAPTTGDCITLDCQQLKYVQPMVTPNGQECKFVCVDIFYSQEVPWAPVTVAWMPDVKSSSACSAKWVNARILRPLLLLDHIQAYADASNIFSEVYQYVPWLNFSKEDPTWTDSTNCKLTATTYCGIRGSGYSGYDMWWCGRDNINGLDAADPDIYALYVAINFAGVADISPALNSYDCEGRTDPPPWPDFRHVIPNITFPGKVPTSFGPGWAQRVRTQLVGLFWRVFLGYGTSEECTGTATYDIEYAAGETFPIEVDLEWVDIVGQTGCLGMPGCGDYGDSECSDGVSVPGCSYIQDGTTVASTTATIPVVTNFGSFAPSQPGPPTSKVTQGYDRADHDATYAAVSVGAFLVFFLVLFGVACRKKGEEEDDGEGDGDEEHQPFMMG